MAGAIGEKRAVTVLQLLNRDPSLALEKVSIKISQGGSAREVQQDLAVACINHDLTAGYMFAVGRGYDPTKLLQPALVKMASTGVSAESDIGVLLAMGADPNAAEPTVDDPGVFAKAMSLAYPPDKVSQSPGLISMLLDAKASPVFPDAVNCPLTTLVLTGGWDDAEKRREHLMQMVRLVKAGLPVDRATGSLRLKPVALAIGKKNGHALVGLVQLGCSVDADALPGKKDLYQVMEANGLQDFKPMVQEALMARQIAKAKKEAAASGAADPAASEAPRPRRRLGAL